MTFHLVGDPNEDEAIGVSMYFVDRVECRICYLFHRHPRQIRFLNAKIEKYTFISLYLGTGIIHPPRFCGG